MCVLVANKFPSVSYFNGVAKLVTAAVTGLPDSVSTASPFLIQTKRPSSSH